MLNEKKKFDKINIYHFYDKKNDYTNIRYSLEYQLKT